MRKHIRAGNVLILAGVILQSGYGEKTATPSHFPELMQRGGLSMQEVAQYNQRLSSGCHLSAGPRGNTGTVWVCVCTNIGVTNNILLVPQFEKFSTGPHHRIENSLDSVTGILRKG